MNDIRKDQPYVVVVLKLMSFIYPKIKNENNHYFPTFSVNLMFTENKPRAKKNTECSANHLERHNFIYFQQGL